MIRFLLIATMAFGMVGCSGNRQADKQENASDTRAGTEAAATWETEKRDYSRTMQERLDRIDREIDEERARAEGRKLNAKARREYNERLTELDKLKQETREQWNKAQSATKEGWQDFKRSMDEAANKLDNSWERFKAELKS